MKTLSEILDQTVTRISRDHHSTGCSTSSDDLQRSKKPQDELENDSLGYSKTSDLSKQEMKVDLDDIYGSGKWLRAGDLQGRATVVKIAGYDTTEFKQKDGTQKKQLVLKFEGKEKELGLNWTNAKRCADLCGSRDPEDWIGQNIELYPTEVEAFGETVEAIRIRAPKKQREQVAPKRVPETIPYDDPEDPGIDDDIPF